MRSLEYGKMYFENWFSSGSPRGLHSKSSSLLCVVIIFWTTYFEFFENMRYSDISRYFKFMICLEMIILGNYCRRQRQNFCQKKKKKNFLVKCTFFLHAENVFLGFRKMELIVTYISPFSVNFCIIHDATVLPSGLSPIMNLYQYIRNSRFNLSIIDFHSHIYKKVALISIPKC